MSDPPPSTPPPIDYATPYVRPRGRRVLLVTLLLVALLLATALFALVFLSPHRVQVVVTPMPTPAPTPAPVTIVSPKVSSRLTIVQRREAALGGSADTVFARISDITRGQTLLTIRDANGRTLLATRSVREGDIATFNVGSAAHDIELIELHNFLTGSSDYAVFEVRTAGSPRATIRAAATTQSSPSNRP